MDVQILDYIFRVLRQTWWWYVRHEPRRVLKSRQWLFENRPFVWRKRFEETSRLLNSSRCGATRLANENARLMAHLPAIIEKLARVTLCFGGNGYVEYESIPIPLNYDPKAPLPDISERRRFVPAKQARVVVDIQQHLMEAVMMHGNDHYVIEVIAEEIGRRVSYELRRLNVWRDAYRA